MLLKAAFSGILALYPFFLYQSQAHPYKYLKSYISPALTKSPEQKEPKQGTEDCGRDVKSAEDLAVALCQPWSTLTDSAEPTKGPPGAYLGQPGLQHPR